MLKRFTTALLLIAAIVLCTAPAFAQGADLSSTQAPNAPATQTELGVDSKAAGGEAELVLPDLSSVQFRGMTGRNLLLMGLIVCVLGLLFGVVMYTQLKNLAVHSSMREISE